MSAFIGFSVTAELIRLPRQLMCEDGEVKKAVVITCAVTNKLREKMLMKTSDLKRLRDGEGVIIIIIMGVESVSASKDVIGNLTSPWATINS